MRCSTLAQALAAGACALGCHHAVPVDARSAVVPSGSTGQKSIIVLALQTAQSRPDCTNAALDTTLFSGPLSIARFYRENSYDLLRLSGMVTGPFSISIGDRCDRLAWADSADSAASAAGIDVSVYTFKLYVEPRETRSLCRYGGDGTIRGSRQWVRSDFCDSEHVIAFSLGLNLGVPVGETPGDHWGDVSTAMGGYVRPSDTSSLTLRHSMVHFNAPQKISLGWVPPKNVQNVASAGAFRIAVLDRPSHRVQVLRVKAGDTEQDYYYLSYRRAVGFSSDLRTAYADKTSVTRRGGISGPNNTTLLGTLGDGQSFTNEWGLTVTQTRHDASYAYVAVSFARPSR